IVADAVPTGSPDQLVAIEAEEIARRLQVTPIAQLERGVKMPVRVDLHQIDGVIVATAAQKREEIAHPIGFANAEHLAIELRDVLDVGDEKRDVAELVRDNAFSRKALAGEGVAFEYFHHGALRILEGDHVRDRGLGVSQALGLDAVALDLFLERAEVVLRRDLKSETRALRLRSLAQHHRMMVERRCKIRGILALTVGGEADDLWYISCIF